MSSRTIVVLGTVLLAWAAWPGTAQAEPISFKVPLSGGQEVPPVFPAGAGTAELTYDSATRVLTWTVTYRALSSPVTMAQFHGPAQPGKNARSVLSLVKPGSPMRIRSMDKLRCPRIRPSHLGAVNGTSISPLKITLKVKSAVRY